MSDIGIHLFQKINKLLTSIRSVRTKPAADDPITILRIFDQWVV